MQFKASATPNPNAIKFTFTVPLFKQRIEVKKGSAPNNGLLAQLFAIEGVDGLFAVNDFITVNKAPSSQWDDLLPSIRQALENYRF
ncbi:NifU N-terminal domain-containing protein [Sporolactobacillus sp. KGMB 08714]|uniref:NifU N-terminal domain-containing protein n=1 Tax=Sporolactobacillus sp. KGMB 08714 TaxID=3064704 RepID=UPI002FBE531F